MTMNKFKIWSLVEKLLTFIIIYDVIIYFAEILFKDLNNHWVMGLYPITLIPGLFIPFVVCIVLLGYNMGNLPAGDLELLAIVSNIGLYILIRKMKKKHQKSITNVV